MIKHSKSTFAVLIISWKSFRNFLVGGFLTFVMFFVLFALVPIFLFASQPSCRTNIEKEAYSPDSSQVRIRFTARELATYCAFGDYIYTIELARFLEGKEMAKTKIYVDATNSQLATFRWLSSRELRVCMTEQMGAAEYSGVNEKIDSWNEVKISKRFNLHYEKDLFNKECYSN